MGTMSGDKSITRRTFLRRAMTGALAMAGGALVPVAASAAKKKPNIVFIIADDMGWADIGYHGSWIQTPNLDRLARDGVRLERHYVMPTCTPTRVGLMTGHYPSRYGVVSPAYGEIFNDDTVTLPVALRASGYTTHLSGKWHMGSPPQWTPRKYGFDSSYGYFHGQIDPYTHRYKTGERSWHRNDEYLDEPGHATDLITDEAIRIIESHEDQPFFLYVAYSVPHHPLDEPDEWTSRYEGKFAEPSRRWLAGSLTHMDHGVGQIVAALDREGLRDNTLIVFVSDNGGQKSWQSDTHYEGRYADKPHTVLGNNKPLRGWKGEVYEGGIRVPALVNWPGVLEPGQCDAPMHIVDWMPTLCGLTGARPPRDVHWDGTDVWASVTGQTKSTGSRSLYWKAPKYSAVRHGDWKLILNNDGSESQLYNLASDPYETKDLASQQPQQVTELTRMWTNFTTRDRNR